MGITPEQRQSIARIEALGGDVFFELGTNMQVVETIALRGPKFGDQELRLLDPFPSDMPFFLGFVNTKVSDAGMAYVRRFTRLRGFSLFQMPSTDAALVHLQPSSDLSDLTLSEIKITSAGFKQLDLSPCVKLSSLSLSKTLLDDESLEQIARLPALTWLSVGGTKITDRGLAHLGKLTLLDTLLLNNTQIGDEGLRHLRGLQRLDSLRLDGTQVTDAGLVHLRAFKELKELNLAGTAVTNAGLVHLQPLAAIERLSLDRTAIDEDGLRHLQEMPKLGWNGWISADGTKVSKKALVRFKMQLPVYRSRPEQFLDELEEEK